MKFKNLKIRQRSLDLTYDKHQLTRVFPKEEQFIFTSQLKRAADYVCLIIAEETLGQSDKDFFKYLTISIQSAVEAAACLHIAKKRQLIDEPQFKKYY